MADYCPVAQNYYYDVINQHFVGRCDIGTGDYGTGIYYGITKETAKSIHYSFDASYSDVHIGSPFSLPLE